jgi:hypothetical protein
MRYIRTRGSNPFMLSNGDSIQVSDLPKTDTFVISFLPGRIIPSAADPDQTFRTRSIGVSFGSVTCSGILTNSTVAVL